MKGRWWHTLLLLVVATTVIFWINDALAILARGEKFSMVRYGVHLAIVAAVVIYAGYVKQQVKALTRRLCLYRHAWRKLPFSLAVIRQNALEETLGNPELLEVFGLGAHSAETAIGGQRSLLSQAEERFGPGGKQWVADRYIIPLPEYNGGGYVIEFLADRSELARTAREQESEYVQMLKVLVNMFEMKDPYCQGHSEVVSNLAQEMAKALALSREDIDVITKAGLLHDIGKIIIPQEILNSSRGLSPAEREIIESHAEVGFEILANLKVFHAEAVIVRHHHERFDGRGYPDGLAGAWIPLGSRILAVADAFDAMTAGRSVRGRRSVEEALLVLKEERGGQFDPHLVDLFDAVVKTGRTAGKVKG
ncbi:MAG TPA: HD-GYP domain-containing protein [Selenomonadales bacterium]|nr:HD-GYP domain-containing protein [Selenomonadales bacterium]